MESLSDVKILLSGGKVPLTKDAGSWKTELNHLNREETVGNRSGMEYREYLGILLSFSSKETLTMRCMDMVEKNIQKKPGREHFSLDDCLDAISVSCIFTGPGGITWQADRIYTYDM